MIEKMTYSGIKIDRNLLVGGKDFLTILNLDNNKVNKIKHLHGENMTKILRIDD